MSLKKKISLICGVLLALVLVISFFIPTPFNCWEVYIDIVGGRKQVCRRILCIPVTKRMEDTSLTKRYRKLIGEPPDPIWRIVSASPPFGISPHTKHHLSLYEAEQLDKVLNIPLLTDEARVCAIQEFLHRLQADDDYFEAARFVRRLNDLCSEAEKANCAIRAKDIASLSPSPSSQPLIPSSPSLAQPH